MPASLAGSKATTLKDIARQLNVSVSAVSYTLSGAQGTTRISPDTAALIRETAKRMNYRKSVGAADLRQQTMRRIGVVVEKFIAGYPMLVRMSALAGLQEYLQYHGFSLDLLPEPMTDWPDGVVPEYIRTRNHAALVLYSHSGNIDEWLTTRCVEHALPWVLMDGTPRQPNTVALDEFSAGSVAAKHLLELGHRRVAYIGYDTERTAKVLEGRLSEELNPPADTPRRNLGPRTMIPPKLRPPSVIHDETIQRLKPMVSGPRSNGLKTIQKSDVTRYRGYQAAMAAARMPIIGFEWAPDTPEVPGYRNRAMDLEVPELRARFRSFLHTERPTALVCYNDAFAWTTIQLIREGGLNVPADISVVGINNLAATNFCSPDLTTVTLHYSDLGLHAGQLLLSRLETAEDVVPGRVMPCGLHVRRSTQPLAP